MINIRLSPEDFVVVEGAVDITKDGLLKILSAIPRYEIETKMEHLSTEMVVILARVKVFHDGLERIGEGRGVATKAEVEKRKSIRAEHDMIALAETRAIKRAIETALGTAVINSEVRRLINEGVLPAELWKKNTPQLQQQPIQKPKPIQHQPQPIQYQPQQQSIQEQESQQEPNQEQIQEKIQKFVDANKKVFEKIYDEEEIEEIKSAKNWKELYEKAQTILNRTITENNLEEFVKKFDKKLELKKYKPRDMVKLLDRFADFVIKGGR